MKRMQGADRPSDRALLVALNSSPGLARAALCRLGLELASWRDGIPPGAEPALAARFSIPLDSLRAALACRAGARAALAAATARELGVHDVANLAGGVRGWVAAGGPVEPHRAD